MKIIHFHPDVRMATKFVGPLMEAERRAGHQTELVSSVSRLGYECAALPFNLSASNFPSLPSTLRRVRMYLREKFPDVVFCHNTRSSLLPLFGAWSTNVPVRVYFNHGVPYVAYSGILRWFFRLIERWNLTLATHVVTVSQDMVPLLLDVKPHIRVKVIQHGSASGIDLEAFSPMPYSQANRRKLLGLGIEDLVVVYVGRPETRKGFRLVTRLWADHFRRPDIKLVMCGPNEDDIKRTLGEIPSNVVALGFTDDVAEVLACSDLLILPSLHEGLSYACLEAQASGTLVVANDIPGLRSLIENGVNGILISGNTREKYIEVIEELYKNRAVFSHLQRNASEDVKKFARKLFMPAYLGFLRDLGPKQGDDSFRESDE